MAIQNSLSKTLDVAVVGEIFADHVFSGLAQWPQPGEEHFSDNYVREAGGGAVITACALGRLGRSVAIFGVIGEGTSGLRSGSKLRSRFGVASAGEYRHRGERKYIYPRGPVLFDLAWGKSLFARISGRIGDMDAASEGEAHSLCDADHTPGCA